MRTIRDPRTCLALLVGAVVALSCAADRRLYEGPPLPADQVALISRDAGARIRVLEIDGEYVPAARYEVLPGEHRLRLYIRRINGPVEIYSVCEAVFVAEAGEQYVVSGSGEIDRIQRDLYDFRLAAWVARADRPQDPVGGYDCDMREDS